MEKPLLPFGMYFEEKVEATNYPLKPTYNPDKSISFVDHEDESVPFVQWEWEIFAGTRTGTSTKDRGDTEDSDEDIRSPRTQTITENEEHTDSD